MSIVHTAVKASDLRPGDVIRIGVSENYILAYEITRAGDEIAVWAEGASQRPEWGPSLRFKASDKAFVSRRDYRPWEG